MLQGFPTPSKYKVLVRCNTFNQAKYIEDTLKGFAMQQTNFPFLVYVIDDASTDGEQDILKNWIDNHCNRADVKIYDNELAIILMSKDKDNENCIYAIHLLKKNLFMKPEKQELHKIWRDQCEYEASCEGDDYWIAEDKLQKQVDWMDTHTECMLCATDAVIETDMGTLDWRRYRSDVDVPLNDIIEHGGLYLQTASFLIRSGIQSDMPECGRNCHVGDYPLIIWCGLNGTVRYIDAKMVKYRYGYGWTKTFGKKPFDVRLKGWLSEVNMLLGFDKYSNFKYHESFSKRIDTYILGIFYSSPKDSHALRKQFCEYYKRFSLQDKVKLALYAYNLGFILKLLKLIKNIVKK